MSLSHTHTRRCPQARVCRNTFGLHAGALQLSSTSGILCSRQPGRALTRTRLRLQETTPDRPRAVGQRREGTWGHRCSLPCRSLSCGGLSPPCCPWHRQGIGEGGWARFTCRVPYDHICLLWVNSSCLSSGYLRSPQIQIDIVPSSFWGMSHTVATSP